jgi:hypothetical protein
MLKIKLTIPLYAKSKEFDIPFVLALRIRSNYLLNAINHLNTRLVVLVESMLNEPLSSEIQDLIYQSCINSIIEKLDRLKAEWLEIQLIKPFEPVTYTDSNQKLEKAKSCLIESIMPNRPKGRSQSRLMYCSPLREDSTPSFVVYLDTNTAFDFGIGQNYDVISLYQALHNTTFQETINQLTQLTI